MKISFSSTRGNLEKSSKFPRRQVEEIKFSICRFKSNGYLGIQKWIVFIQLHNYFSKYRFFSKGISSYFRLLSPFKFKCNNFSCFKFCLSIHTPRREEFLYTFFRLSRAHISTSIPAKNTETFRFTCAFFSSFLILSLLS